MPDALDHLGTLIRMNHGFLVSLGISHPRLERIRELVDYADINWTKLTGARGGGCAITLFRADVKDETIKKLERKLTAQKYETVLGCFGPPYSETAPTERAAKPSVCRVSNN
jgi:mevalonate kinase